MGRLMKTGYGAVEMGKLMKMGMLCRNGEVNENEVRRWGRLK